VLSVDTLAELAAHVGRDIGSSGWLTVDQALIDRFADVTGDRNWYHVDRERAARELPGGLPIAHGLLTLSLGPALAYSIYSVAGIAMALNYGYDRVRFPAPLPSGSRVRMTATLKSVSDVPGGVQVVVTQTFEREGESKPVCVAEQVARLVAAPGS